MLLPCPTQSLIKETTMFARLRRRESAPRAAAGNPAPSLRRLAAAAATVIIGMLASAAIVPAAFAEILVPGSGGASGTTRLAPVPATTVRVVNAGGMTGWQITLIAAGAAVVAAAVAILLDRTLATHRAASAPHA
jgi:hypothetical protein